MTTKRKAEFISPNSKRTKTNKFQSPRKSPVTKNYAVGGENAWKRPSAHLINILNNTTKPFHLQQVDCDYFEGFPPDTRNRDYKLRRPIIRLYGSTFEGNSVLVYVTGFRPYFYLDTWKGFDEKLHLEPFKKALELQLARDSKKPLDKYVHTIEVVTRSSIWGFTPPNTKNSFLRIEVTSPRLCRSAQRLLKTGFKVGNNWFGEGRDFNLQIYECEMNYALRFMIDTDIRGGGWIELPQGTYARVNQPASRCQLELKTSFETVTARNGEGKWMKIAPMRILSFDIECQSLQGGFPEPERGDPVIQISNVVKEQGAKFPFIKNVFCLKKTASCSFCEIRWFNTEKEMLIAWAKFVQKVDPDMFTGYNIMNFDFIYLLKRAKELKIENDFNYLGRIKTSRTNFRKKEFNSAQKGSFNFHEVSVEGRVIFDLLPIIRGGHKLKSYSLNSVSSHFLQEQKDDVHYSIMSDLQNGDEFTRKRLAKYCLKDSELVIRLMDKLLLVINNIEMARVTGVPISYLVTRGQGIRVISQLYRKCRKQDIIIPIVKKTQMEGKFQGATVLDPTTGFYKLPITTLDFASLYPSIMMAHNLCYSTYTSKQRALMFGLTEDDLTRTPNGFYFVKSSVKKGLLPEILDDLLSSRKRAKKDMKSTTDPFLKAVYNGRQLALKVSANSVYGFTGAQNGALCCMAISASVTSFGRNMIDDTKKYVENHYTIANGYEHNAQVIYGDTDSVMIKFGLKDIGKSMVLGNEAAALVSKIFVPPIRLEFEKVYKPYLLMNKKRYAGMLYTKPEKWDYMDAKGIETVRRDNCGWVRETLQTVLDNLLIDESVDKAKAHIEHAITCLMQNKIDLSQLVISKQLQKLDSYVNKQPHAELAKRMAKRDPGSAPATGDRVPFVYVKKGKKARAFEKSEDPLWVLEHDLPIDNDYYLENQLSGPIKRIFEPILGDKTDSLFWGKNRFKIKKTFNAGTSKKGGLFGMSSFIVVKEKCMKCGSKLGEKVKGAFCAKCKPFEGQVYLQKTQELKLRQKNYSDYWIQCQHCQGSLTQEVLCSNRDCPIFYRRMKCRKDLEKVQDALKKFTF